eukprot:2232150-Prymnesium_polylepis.1
MLSRSACLDSLPYRYVVPQVLAERPRAVVTRVGRASLSAGARRVGGASLERSALSGARARARARPPIRCVCGCVC